jgi:hypothetical protein
VLIFDESADTAELYINGVSKGVVSSITRQYPASPGNFVAGSVVDGAVSLCDGKMDEMAVYESALSPARTLYHYQAGTNTLPKELPSRVTQPVDDRLFVELLPVRERAVRRSRSWPLGAVFASYLRLTILVMATIAGFLVVFSTP